MISTSLVFHEENRVVPCFLCRSSWEERLVGVKLDDEDCLLGNLCPRCLRYSPRQNATWLNEYSQQFRRAVADLNESLEGGSSMPESPDHYRAEILKVVQATAQIQQMSALLRRGTRNLQNDFSRTRRALDQFRYQAGTCRDDEFMSFVISELSRMDRVLSISSSLLKLPDWQTTVDDLMRGEHECLVGKFSLDPRMVTTLIQRRYGQFLVGTESPPSSARSEVKTA